MIALTNATQNGAYKIVFIWGGLRRKAALARMGLRCGERLRVMSLPREGAVWIHTKNAQIALSRESARRILIK